MSQFDAASEREDRIRRIADANMHYRNMNLMLDAGVQDRGVVFQAHQALDPVTDFTRMADDVTNDLERIHQRIAELTGEAPWTVSPEDNSDPVGPRYRR